MPRLRAAVGYHPEVGDAQLLGDLGDHLKAVSHHSGVLRGDLPAGADVDLGDHQEVGGRLGVDVVKGVDGVSYTLLDGISPAAILQYRQSDI